MSSLKASHILCRRLYHWFPIGGLCVHYYAYKSVLADADMGSYG